MGRIFKDAIRRSPLGFDWRYWRGETPWDTQITPPEVVDFIAGATPGRALDLGCGSGTNAITLARHGWLVTGVDFAPRAIRMARRKAALAGLSISFHVASVTNLSMLESPYDYVLDIGCLFVLGEKERMSYAKELIRLTKPGAWYMLYAWLPKPWRGGRRGISPEEVDLLLSGKFFKARQAIGEEKGSPSAWYWFQRL